MLRYPGNRLDLAPLLPAVLGDLHEPIVSSCDDETFEQRRFVEGGNRAERSRRLVERHRIGRPDFAHDGDLRGVELACQIAADRPPGIPPVVAAIDALACEVEPARRMRADD